VEASQTRTGRELEAIRRGGCVAAVCVRYAVLHFQGYVFIFTFYVSMTNHILFQLRE